jgi:hypothetical protein
MVPRGNEEAMKTFSKVALACVLFFALTGSAWAQGAKDRNVKSPAAAGNVYSVACAGDNNIPGIAAPASPITGALDENTDWDDVYRVWLEEGQTLSASLTAAAETDFDLYLYAPGATSVDVDDPVADSALGVYPEAFDYTAPTSGFYYIEVYADTGVGPYILTYSTTPGSTVRPVYRLYNRKNGSHFYTATLSECNKVIDTLDTIYTYEGPAYQVDTSNALNSSPLYRFYNKKNGSHFYTSSLTEKYSVLNSLSATYSYDGVAYKVSATPGPGSTSVYRFYNKKNGSHFYTASSAEKNKVLDTLGATYALDGVAFYIWP